MSKRCNEPGHYSDKNIFLTFDKMAFTPILDLPDSPKLAKITTGLQKGK